MEHQKNQDQEITGLIQIVNSPQVIINSLVHNNDYGELKKRLNSIKGNFQHLKVGKEPNLKWLNKNKAIHDWQKVKNRLREKTGKEYGRVFSEEKGLKSETRDCDILSSLRNTDTSLYSTDTYFKTDIIHQFLSK